MRKKSLEKCAEEHVRVEFGATISGVQERREGVGSSAARAGFRKGIRRSLGIGLAWETPSESAYLLKDERNLPNGTGKAIQIPLETSASVSWSGASGCHEAGLDIAFDDTYGYAVNGVHGEINAGVAIAATLFNGSVYCA